jgi:hypothetical protein
VRCHGLPERWRKSASIFGDHSDVITTGFAGVAMGISELIFCVSVLAFGFCPLGYDIDTLTTLSFIVIVFGNQATTYTNRERRRLWSFC